MDCTKVAVSAKVKAPAMYTALNTMTVTYLPSHTSATNPPASGDAYATALNSEYASVACGSVSSSTSFRYSTSPARRE